MKLQNYKIEAESMTLAGLAREMKSQKERVDTAKKAEQLERAKLEVLTLQVVPDKMESEEISSLKINGVGRLGLTLDAHVGIRVEHRPAFYAWLEQNGHSDIIKPYAQPGTIKALIKDLVKQGEVLPDDIISFQPFYRASVTKT